MESLELPLDMLWASATKREPVSPSGAGKCFINDDPFLGHHADELWTIEQDDILSCFGIEDELLATSTTTTTIGQKKRSRKDDDEEKVHSAQELLKDLIELKEEEQWMNQENVDLSTLTAVAQDVSCGASFAQLSQQQQLMGSLYPEALTLSAPVTPSVSPGLQLGGCDATTTTTVGSTNNNNSYAAASTELLFNEIKSFCNDYEAARSYQHQQLTPPQSPPPTTTSPLFGGHAYEMQEQQRQMYPNQVRSPPDQKPILGNYPVDGSAAGSAAAVLIPLQHEARSFVDLQLQSSECMDKTFVFSGDESQGEVAASPVQPTLDELLENTNVDAADALALINELLRDKTKEVHENYVLVSHTAHVDVDAGQEYRVAKKTKPVMQLQQVTTSPDDMDVIMMDYTDDSATQFSSPSYGSSLASSPARSGTPQMDSQDEDWMPEEEQAPQKRKTKGASAASTSSSSSSAARRRPYERGGGEVEKKYRKKEQNKNAATRYRQKKKQEVEVILEEETRLKKANKKLVSQFNDARREMKYLRNLLKDMYKQNNIII